MKNAKENQKLVYTIKDAEGNVVVEQETLASQTVASLEIEKNVHLWHGRKDPYLYTAEVYLKSEDEVFRQCKHKIWVPYF